MDTRSNYFHYHFQLHIRAKKSYKVVKYAHQNLISSSILRFCLKTLPKNHTIDILLCKKKPQILTFQKMVTTNAWDFCLNYKLFCVSIQTIPGLKYEGSSQSVRVSQNADNIPQTTRHKNR